MGLATAPARLSVLLPWLNGDHDEHVWGPNPLYGQPYPYGAGEGPEDFATRTDYAAIRRAIAAFVGSFDGSAEAAHVVAEPDDTVEALDDEAIGDLEAQLRILLDQGFGEPWLQDPDICSFALDRLRIAVRGAGRRKPAKRGSVIAGGVTALHNYRAPGAYTFVVRGPLRALLPFLLGHLLLAPNMVTVGRCERQGCGHYVITATGKRGRPQRFCSAACREWNREHESQRKARRKKQ